MASNTDTETNAEQVVEKTADEPVTETDAEGAADPAAGTAAADETAAADGDAADESTDQKQNDEPAAETDAVQAAAEPSAPAPLTTKEAAINEHKSIIDQLRADLTEICSKRDVATLQRKALAALYAEGHKIAVATSDELNELLGELRSDEAAIHDKLRLAEGALHHLLS